MTQSPLELYHFEKRACGRYASCNEHFAQLADIDSTSKIKGLCDTDLIWHTQADFFEQVHRHIMRGHSWHKKLQPLVVGDSIENILISVRPKRDAAGLVVGTTASFVRLNGLSPAALPREQRASEKRFHLGPPFHAYLTASECRVLTSILQGKTNAQIAASTSLSKRTVDDYVDKIKQKFQVDSKCALIALCYREGIALLLSNR